MFKTERNEEIKGIDESMESDNECYDEKDYAFTQEVGGNAEIGASQAKSLNDTKENRPKESVDMGDTEMKPETKKQTFDSLPTFKVNKS